MVQVIPRTTKQGRSLLKIILPWLSILLIVLVILGIFFFGSRIKSGQARLSELTQEVAEGMSDEDTEIKDKLINYKKNVNNVVAILEERERVVEFYAFLEALVHPDIYFTKLDLNMETGVAQLKGVAKDFEVLGQQIQVFKETDYVYKAETDNVTLDQEEGIGFNITISLYEPEEK